jgi:hypothetical protein
MSLECMHTYVILIEFSYLGLPLCTVTVCIDQCTLQHADFHAVVYLFFSSSFVFLCLESEASCP